MEKRNKKTLVLMGTHWKGLKNFDWNRKDCEIWMFNEAAGVKLNGKAYYPKQPDKIFQLHHEAIWKNPKNRSDEKHYQWLSSGDTPPIYMQQKYSDVPMSIEYPITDILTLTKNVKLNVDGFIKEFKYFSSSPEYALALAALMNKKGQGFKRIEIWGIELEHESEYVYQRTGFAFWSGYLAGMGIELILANSIFDSPMYGYEGDIPITSEFLKQRVEELNKEIGNKREFYTKEAKEFLDSIWDLLYEDTSQKIEQDLNALIKRNESAGIMNGKIKECEQYLEKAKLMEERAKSSVFSIGEFDAMRHVYNKEYTETKNDAINLNAQIGLVIKRIINLKKGNNKRKRAIDELGKLITDLVNKNMTLLHIIGAIQENQYFIDSAKLSLRSRGGKL